MLSTLAARKLASKALASVRLISVTPQRHSALVPGQEATIEKAPYQDDYPSSANIPLTLEEKVVYWKRANDVFFGPDRDTKNFPHPEYKEKITEEYNFGVIPTRWFKALYPQLGVSGCYTLVWGSILFGISKEYIVLDHEFYEFLIVIGFVNWVRFKYGDKISAYLVAKQALRRKELYEEPLENATSGYKTEVAELKEEIARQDAIPVIFQAKQEQIDLQLEAEYRQRLAEVHDTVRRRLEYQADMEHAQRSFEQDHMVNWIVNNVKKSITPQQEKESIANCIKTLKNMSATAAL
ncbi:ATP synthase subunit b, mitochondrial-like [Mercenaria mercenaria]|uniref:ATP synthase subunit b, mitochondrial-like n=1 Tax=Mercenaria mercenaria TaxID=6596 RepID=UPI00234E79F6|nr:ATP synthase subunit b, mitochondrial-like [Mercenaria mercenaria]